jgi:membrane-associated protein
MSAFETFAREYAAYGYPVVFLGVLLENAGIPVPGETAVLVAGFLASQGHFRIELVILLTVLAAVIGDNLGFWLGHRWARPRLQAGRGFLFLTPKTLQLAEGYFDRYGVWTIFFARFITGLRVVGALAAGTAGMAWPRFLVANAAGALVWAVTMSLLGYFFGHSLDFVHKLLGGGGLILLGSLTVLVGLPLAVRHLRNRKPELWDRLVRGQIWQGLLAAVLEVICIGILAWLAQHPPRAAEGPDRRAQEEGKEWVDVDEQVKEWVAPVRRATPFSPPLARWTAHLGTLPVVVAACLALLVQQRLTQRSWREKVALIAALVLSEAVGLVLLALIRHRGIEPERTSVWPHGFAGLAPLRAFAVFGMAAQLLAVQRRSWGRIAKLIAALVVLLVGASVIWAGEQTFTEVLLEFAAGGIVLFGCLWWLEGFGRLLPLPRRQAESNPTTPSVATLPQR